MSRGRPVAAGVVGVDLLTLLAVDRARDQMAYGQAVVCLLVELGTTVAPATVYNSLGRHVQDGLMTRQDSGPLPMRGGRSKPIYELTTRGQQSLAAALDLIMAMRQRKDGARVT